MSNLFCTRRFYCRSGSPDKIIYEPYFDERGARRLRPVGKESLSEYIQSFKEMTDINLILKRFELGDLSVLNAQHGVFADFTQAPKTLHEFLNAQIQANQIFERLPADLRNSFDNDVNKFFMQYGSPEWMKVVEPFIKSPESEVTE